MDKSFIPWPLVTATLVLPPVVKAGFQETAKQLKRIEQKHDKKMEDYEERIERLEHASPAIPHKN